MKKFAQYLALNTSVVALLGSAVWQAEIHEPDVQQGSSSVIDTFDPVTGTITRTNQ